MDALNLSELELLARSRLTQMAWDYYASGADDERCVRRNTAAYDELVLHYRVLVNVATRNLATTVLGHELAMPIAVAPTAFHRLAHDDGELASVQGAGDAKTLFILSTLSNTPVEQVVEAASGPVWFQLYVYKDRGATEALIRRVEAAGCQALVVTVDAPLLGRRERDVRNRFTLPPGLAIENLHAAGYSRLPPAAGDSALAAYVAQLLDPSLTWEVIGWLRSITRLPVLVKGIVRADDAARAIDHGAAGVVVSNHGGRQLDASPATIEVLPRIANAIGQRGVVLLDGGVRRGADVIKAVALGARAVLVGRPVLWGLAVGGRAGVAGTLAMLRRELDLAMALCGCPDMASVTGDLIDGRPPVIWTVLGTLGITLMTIVAGLLADRRWSLLPRREALIAAGRPRPLLTGHATGDAAATAIQGSWGDIERLRRKQRCPQCRADMDAIADARVTFEEHELLVLRFACPRCATERSVYVKESSG